MGGQWRKASMVSWPVVNLRQNCNCSINQTGQVTPWCFSLSCFLFFGDQMCDAHTFDRFHWTSILCQRKTKVLLTEFLSSFSASSCFCSTFHLPPAPSLPQVPSSLRASSAVGGSAGTILGSLQLHNWPEVFSPQPLWLHLGSARAVCSWSWSPRHQCYRLSLVSVASYRLFAPQCLTTIKCQMCLFMVCL